MELRRAVSALSRCGPLTSRSVWISACSGFVEVVSAVVTGNGVGLDLDAVSCGSGDEIDAAEVTVVLDEGQAEPVGDELP